MSRVRDMIRTQNVVRYIKQINSRYNITFGVIELGPRKKHPSNSIYPL